MKETFALYEVLRPLVEARPDFPESPHYHDGRRQYSDDLGKKAGHRTSKCTNWSGNSSGYKYKQTSLSSCDGSHSEENSEVDRMTRPDAWEHVRLRQWHLDNLWIIWGGFDMDLMASTASAERSPPHTSARTVIIVPDTKHPGPHC